MTDTELKILRLFRSYGVGPDEMLFVSLIDAKAAGECFPAAMRRLIAKGLIVKERPQHAYALTRAGYRLARSATVRDPPVRRRAAR